MAIVGRGDCDLGRFIGRIGRRIVITHGDGSLTWTYGKWKRDEALKQQDRRPSGQRAGHWGRYIPCVGSEEGKRKTQQERWPGIWRVQWTKEFLLKTVLHRRITRGDREG
jgi:hypothetical protein